MRDDMPRRSIAFSERTRMTLDVISQIIHMYVGVWSCIIYYKRMDDTKMHAVSASRIVQKDMSMTWRRTTVTMVTNRKRKGDVYVERKYFSQLKSYSRCENKIKTN